MVAHDCNPSRGRDVNSRKEGNCSMLDDASRKVVGSNPAGAIVPRNVCWRLLVRFLALKVVDSTCERLSLVNMWQVFPDFRKKV